MEQMYMNGAIIADGIHMWQTCNGKYVILKRVLFKK